MQSACPDENELVRFARGALDEVSGASVSSHLDSCSSCRRAVAEAASEEPRAQLTVQTGARVGRYEVDALLGAGAMGSVFSARDAALNRRVAIKLLHATGDEQSRARLEREAQAMARLNHPHVVTVHELGDWSGGRFIAMELVEGQTLDAWLPTAKPAERRRVLLDAGRGLFAAHQAGVVHRDFKPHNLLVGGEGRVRVTDFGLSRAMEGAPLVGGPDSNVLATAHGALVGTPAFMSPEQLDGRTAGERSDQFAFCVVWVEALTGRRPFQGETKQALREAMRGAPVLGRELGSAEKSALRRGLSEDPAARFASMDALLAALVRSARGPGFAAAGAALLLLFLGGAWRVNRTPPPAAIELQVGKTHSLLVECLARAAVGDPEIADVQPVGNDEVVLIGGSVGETTLLLWGCDNHRMSYTVSVLP